MAPSIRPKFLSQSSDLGVVAVGFSGGQGLAGVDAGPTALIESGLLTQLRDSLGYNLHHDDTIHDYESLKPASDPVHRGMKNPRTVSAVTRRLADQVYEHASAGRLVLTLGGDHSIAIGTIAGTARAIRERLGREIAVIWVDAHADINTPETSGSGNIHGMPVAFLTGLAKESNQDIFGWLAAHGPPRNGLDALQAEKPAAKGNHVDSYTTAYIGKGADRNGEPIADGGEGTGAAEGPLSLKKLVYIGLRDVDRGEKEILRRHGIRAFSMHDVDKYGIGRVMELALAHIGTDTPIHLSFDVDALDPQWAPSTGTPVRGGLTLREGDFIAESVAETGSLVAMDLVEVNPSLDVKGASDTVGAGCSLVKCALGDTLL